MTRHRPRAVPPGKPAPSDDIVPNRGPAPFGSRPNAWEGRITWAGVALLGAILSGASLWGAVATWRVAAVFQTGGATVQWQDGPDLVVMAAPLLAAALTFGWFRRHVLRACAAFVGLTVLLGIGLGKADAAWLEHVASVGGYQYCETLDVWDPHGGRGGGPALRSWGYARGPCPLPAATAKPGSR